MSAALAFYSGDGAMSADLQLQLCPYSGRFETMSLAPMPFEKPTPYAVPDTLHTLPAPFPRLLCRDGLAALRVGVPRPSFTGPRRVAREGHSHRGVRVGLNGQFLGL